MRLFNFFIALLILPLVLTLFIPVVQSAQINSYELFWPISPGKVMGENLYYFKLFKENLRGAVIFSDLKKADYNITLAEKRIVEAEQLFIVRKDFANAKRTLDLLRQKQEKAIELLKKAEEKKYQVDQYKVRMIKSFEKQKDLLDNMMSAAPPDQKFIIEDSVNKLDSLLKALK